MLLKMFFSYRDNSNCNEGSWNNCNFLGLVNFEVGPFVELINLEQSSCSECGSFVLEPGCTWKWCECINWSQDCWNRLRHATISSQPSTDYLFDSLLWGLSFALSEFEIECRCKLLPCRSVLNCNKVQSTFPPQHMNVTKLVVLVNQMIESVRNNDRPV